VAIGLCWSRLAMTKPLVCSSARSTRSGESTIYTCVDAKSTMFTSSNPVNSVGDSPNVGLRFSRHDLMARSSSPRAAELSSALAASIYGSEQESVRPRSAEHFSIRRGIR
jgi:hypothetical protein